MLSASIASRIIGSSRRMAIVVLLSSDLHMAIPCSTTGVISLDGGYRELHPVGGNCVRSSEMSS